MMTRIGIGLWAFYATPVSAAQNTLANTPFEGGASLYNMLGSLAGIVLLIVLLGWILKRLNALGTHKTGAVFRVIATQMVGAKERVMLIETGGRYLLIGVGSQSMTTLCDFGEKKPDGIGEGPSLSFKKLMRQAMNKDVHEQKKS